MKKFTFIFFILTAIVSLFAQSYKVSVDVYVGTRIEDKFYFEMNEGEAQVKGFNGKGAHVRIFANDLHLRPHTSLHALKQLRLTVAAIFRHVLDGGFCAFIPKK